MSQLLAHELSYFNISAPQLDAKLLPEERGYRLVLVGGVGPGPGPGGPRAEAAAGLGDDSEPSFWLQYYDNRAVGWGRLGDIGVGRPQRCAAAAVGSRLYAWGGEESLAGPPQPATSYDTVSNEVREVARPLRRIQGSAGVACNSLVYGLGGWCTQHVAAAAGNVETMAVADVCVYNPETDSWMLCPALPAAMTGMAAAEHGGCIYGCEGLVDDGRSPPSGGLFMLDPRTRAWETLPSMPTPVAGAGEDAGGPGGA